MLGQRHVPQLHVLLLCFALPCLVTELGLELFARFQV